MPNIIFSENAQLNNSRIGKLYEPLKLFIQKEADDLARAKNYENLLYKLDTSDNWAEAFVTSDDFDLWGDRAEGGRSQLDSFGETAKKVIEHAESGKGFAITKKMQDDMSTRALEVKAKELAQKFVDSNDRTRNMKMVQALVQSACSAGDLLEGKYIKVAGHKIDVTTADNMPLFSKSHKGGNEALHGEFTQSNFFYTPKTDITADVLVSWLDHLSVLGRNMKDENGNAMGYTFDTVIIPGDNYLLEQMMRRALGSGQFPGTTLNDVCTQYGVKNLMILPEWTTVGTTNPNQFMLMSSKAKDQLHGNQFLERVPMDVKNWICNETRSWMFDGYTRYGIGFPSYKHILRMVVDDASTMSSLATNLESV